MSNEALNGNFAKPMLPARVELQELNLKNEQKDGYSLGDVMLLDKWEKELKANGYSNIEIKTLSPSYYGPRIGAYDSFLTD